MSNRNIRNTATVLLLALGAGGLTACTTAHVPINRTLESVHQPVVQHTNYSLDLAANPGGLASSAARRLAEWFEALDLRYGDRIAVDDPVASSATRASIEAVAGRFGIMVSETAPTTPGYVNAGTVRIIVTRSSASVKGCPDWGTRTDTNGFNATASGYGCSVNGNLAAMIANPEDLVKGAKSTGETAVMSSNKALDSFRNQPVTGEKGLSKSSSKGD